MEHVACHKSQLLSLSQSTYFCRPCIFVEVTGGARCHYITQFYKSRMAVAAMWPHYRCHQFIDRLPVIRFFSIGVLLLQWSTLLRASLRCLSSALETQRYRLQLTLVFFFLHGLALILCFCLCFPVFTCSSRRSNFLVPNTC